MNPNQLIAAEGSNHLPSSTDAGINVAVETDELRTRLQRIEAVLHRLVQQKTIKEWYTTQEVGTLLDRSAYTVREWCREGRVDAEKRKSGRGRSREWMISHEELTRIQNEGLLER